MDISEFPLLNRPALMLLMLKTAAAGSVTLADCHARLKEELDRIREDPNLPDDVILAELEEVHRHLAAARLLDAGEGHAFTLTRRGGQVLESHPLGVDETVLARFPEYRAYLHDFGRRRTADDPRLSRYEEGYVARRDGAALSDNPYPRDSVDHLAWENGWSEARDVESEGRG